MLMVKTHHRSARSRAASRDLSTARRRLMIFTVVRRFECDEDKATFEKKLGKIAKAAFKKD
jgi:hypothetical protein